MPKKHSALLQKLSSLQKISVFVAAKMRKPVITNVIIFLKKKRKLGRLKQYSYYNYVREYEFSPSSTPLIEFRGKAKSGRISFRKLYSNVFFISKCLGMESGGKMEMRCLEMGVAPLPLIGSAGEWTAAIESSESEDESVDERAERFIQRFYEEMRKQRQESNFQLLEM